MLKGFKIGCFCVTFNTMNLYLRALRFIKPYTSYVVLSIFLAVLFSLANVLFLPLSRDIINEIANKNLTNFNNQMLNAALLYIIRLICQHSQFYVTTYVGRRMSMDMQNHFFKKLLALSQDFYTKWKLGEIQTRLFSDVEKVRDTIVLGFWEVLPQTLTLISILVYLIILNWKLTLFSLVAVPIFIVIVMNLADKLKKVAHHVQRKAANLTQIAQESISNIKLIQAYTTENFEAARFEKENMTSFQSTMYGVRYRSLLEPVVSFLQFFVILCIIWYGGYEIAKGTMSGPTLTAFFTGIFMLIDPVLALSKVYSTLQQSMVSVNRFYEFVDTPVKICNKPHVLNTKSIKGRVDFEHVYFRYADGQRDVLMDINMHVNEGEVVALVGHSGVGKSTLINLIPRFYDVTGGCLKIDGMAICDLDVFELRQQIALVPQEDILFRGTILDNIRYGCAKAVDEAVIEAAKKAHAWEFIDKMKGKLYSRVSDRGGNLSGGQKQRISIARAILRNPRILILDEATSALDTESERLVQDALQQLMKNRTTFVIAHRLSTVVNADKIVVMEAGQIKEIGRHQELLAQNGLYAKLYELQFQKK